MTRVIASGGLADGCPKSVVDIKQKLAILGSPRTYAEVPSRVDRIETHFSWVFLTDRYVYKLKKPLRDGGVDLSTLAARKRNAELELRLNRRLAPEVYIAVVPLTLGKSGLAIGGAGLVVDWLVQMRRLPAAQTLEALLLRRDWRRHQIEALGDLLAGFFAAAPPAPVEPGVYLDRLRRECRAGRRALRAGGSPALCDAADKIASRLEGFMHRRGPLLMDRAERGRVVDGHGDLRPEHIWLDSLPLVIDCLEFRADLRQLDPVAELAFLAMECTKLGGHGIGPILFRRYRRRTGDQPPPALITFYTAVSALIRARIAILHLQEIPVRDPEKWPKRAAEYLAIAGSATLRLAF